MQHAGIDGVLKLWYHHSRLGTTDFLTDNVQGKVTSYTAFDDWGALTMKTISKKTKDKTASNLTLANAHK
ncbi:MAG: hypothetical protein FWG48_06900 [Oscillospiraceae bacterium]|nr:hypothetical protein [Oscillospiraceae bacterium]